MFTKYTQRQMPYPIKTDVFHKQPVSVRTTLQPVDREDSNLEAEHGEQAVVPDGSGLPTKFSIAGKPHSEGGTPLNLPSNSFIFSKDKSMRITDPKILEMFGMAARKKGYTPAEIAKKYDINAFRKTLADKDADKLQKDSAESMITNYNEKLAQLALIQESHKGFPTGIPMIAMPYLQTIGLDMTQLMGQQNSDEEDQSEPDQNYTRYGGNIIPEMYRGDGFRQFGGESKFNFFKKGGENKAPSSNKGQVTIQYAGPLKKPRNTEEDSDNNETELRRVRIISPDMMKMGGQPKYQKGKEVKKKETPTYDVTEKQIIKDIFPDAVLPEDMVEPTQKGQSGVYGRFDKSSADKNWAWYGKPIDWTNPHEVKKAQQAYNERLLNKIVEAGYDQDFAKKAVDRIGFSEKSQGPNALDGLAGKYTETRVDLNPVKKAEAAVQVPDVKKSDVKKPDFTVGIVDAKNEETPADFWLQDVIKTAGAAGDLFRVKKYLPWQANYNPYLPAPTYFDPTRELAQNSENAAIAGQTAGMFGTPQQLSARLSQIQGNAGANAANILARYNEMNVNASNQYEQNRAATMNDASKFNAEQKTNLYDQNTIANQNFDNTKMAFRQNLRNAFVDALTNRAQTQALNSIQKQYQVDPMSGGFKKFVKPGTDFAADYYNNQLTNFTGSLGKRSSSADMVDELVNNRGWDRKDAIDYLKAVSGK